MLARWFKRREYRVRLLGVHGVAYSEGTRRVVLDGERLASGGPVDIWYGFQRAQEWASPPGVPMTDAEKALVKERIEVRLKEYGVRAEVSLD